VPARGSHGQIRQGSIFDHLEHDRRGADLQERRDLAEVRVSDDHVQPPVLFGIGVGFVPGIDDGLFSVVSSPTSVSKKSARWVIW